MIETYWPDGTIIQQFEDIGRVQPRVIASINETRDRLIDGGFTFHHGGSTYPIQSRQSDRENVIGLSGAATDAIAAGAQPGDYEWLIPGEPFGFITADNQVVVLDAYGVKSLYRQALGFKSAVTLYARALKDQVLVCADEQAVLAIDLQAGWPGGS